MGGAVRFSKMLGLFVGFRRGGRKCRRIRRKGICSLIRVINKKIVVIRNNK